MDGAIHRAAGPQLKEACRHLGGCPTGDAKITSGYELPAKHVIHTVGPVGEKPTLLESCYRSVLKLVRSHDLRTVAFCCISTGIYGYPSEPAADVALRTVRRWLETENNADKVTLIVFCVFSHEMEQIYKKLMRRYFPLEGGSSLSLINNDAPCPSSDTNGLKT